MNELTDEEILNLARISRYYVGRSEEKDFINCVRTIITTSQSNLQSYYASMSSEELREKLIQKVLEFTYKYISPRDADQILSLVMGWKENHNKQWPYVTVLISK